MSNGLVKILAVTAVVAASATIYQAYHHNRAPSVSIAEHERLGQRAVRLMASLAAANSDREALLTSLTNSVSRLSHDALVARYDSLKVAFDRSREAEARMARKIAELEHARDESITQVSALEGELQAVQEEFDAVHQLYTGRFGPLVTAAVERTQEATQ